MERTTNSLYTCNTTAFLTNLLAGLEKIELKHLLHQMVNTWSDSEMIEVFRLLAMKDVDMPQRYNIQRGIAKLLWNLWPEQRASFYKWFVYQAARGNGMAVLQMLFNITGDSLKQFKNEIVDPLKYYCQFLSEDSSRAIYFILEKIDSQYKDDFPQTISIKDIEEVLAEAKNFNKITD